MMIFVSNRERKTLPTLESNLIAVRENRFKRLPILIWLLI